MTMTTKYEQGPVTRAEEAEALLEAKRRQCDDLMDGVAALTEQVVVLQAENENLRGTLNNVISEAQAYRDEVERLRGDA